jgi:2-dehydro-3-deoxyphosphogalactonate aldolase
VKIADARVFVVGNPPPGFGGRYFVFLRLTTDGGVVGIGEAYSPPVGPDVAQRVLEDVCERRVLGRDPFRIESLFRTIYSSGYSGRADPTLGAALSAIEMACHDIVGKEVGRPVYDLLGGRVHERLRAYTYLYPEDGDATDVYRDPVLAAERALSYADQGFTAVKFDPVGAYGAYDPRQLSPETLDHAERFVRTVREAVGDRCDLLVGTHGQMTPSAALRLARRLEPYDPLWLEEPVPPESPEAMARVARGTTIPIATGERLVGKHEFARVLATGAASILQMNTGRVGGLREAKKIAGMAEAHYAQIAPHLYCGPVVGAANIQLAASCPNFLVLEGIGRWDGFHAEILKRPIRFEDGYVIPSEEPGLGVELDEDTAARHPYSGDRLHLETQDEPITD